LYLYANILRGTLNSEPGTLIVSIFRHFNIFVQYFYYLSLSVKCTTVKIRYALFFRWLIGRVHVTDEAELYAFNKRLILNISKLQKTID